MLGDGRAIVGVVVGPKLWCISDDASNGAVFGVCEEGDSSLDSLGLQDWQSGEGSVGAVGAVHPWAKRLARTSKWQQNLAW
jgi:hypothetical protein